MATEQERNPLIIPGMPEANSRAVRCPACGSTDYTGLSKEGTVTRTCRKCKQVWTAGIGQTALLPGEVYPIEKAPPTFSRGQDGKWEEHIQRESYVPDFRRGAPLPDQGDEEDGY